jgi:hypothetical protein
VAVNAVEYAVPVVPAGRDDDVVMLTAATAAACVIVKVCPAMVRVPVREVVPVFDATV